MAMRWAWALVAVGLLLGGFARAADIQALRQKADQEDIDAQFTLGINYYGGFGVPRDYAEAAKWYRKVADKGNAYAQSILGSMYSQGLGVPQDYVQALMWCNLAVANAPNDMQADWKKARDVTASLMTAVEIAEAQKLTRDWQPGIDVGDKAVRALRKKGEQGDAVFQYRLGVAYDTGQGVAKDQTEAAKWFRKAAEQGFAPAQNSLGGSYIFGQGVPQDIAEAVKWFRKAAEQGYAQAQDSLGHAYRRGLSVPQDDIEATNWYRKGADQGHPEAAFFLGIAYEGGKGVPRNYVEAYKWYTLARNFSEVSDEDRKRAKEGLAHVTERMTSSQIDRAKELVEQWTTQPIQAAPPAPQPTAPPQTASKKTIPASTPSAEPPPPETAQQPTISTGTGFIVSPTGLILTAYHVVSGDGDILVILPDGQTYKAEIARKAPRVDLATLRVKAKTPDFLSLALTGSARVGGQVFTVGFPAPGLLGAEPKYTEGSISALSGLGGDASFLQISVPIQPGNSGGPLLNDKGQVVGVVTSTAAAATFLEATGSLPQNVNWAVSSAYATPLVGQVRKPKSTPKSREDAIDHAMKAVVFVMQQE